MTIENTGRTPPTHVLCGVRVLTVARGLATVLRACYAMSEGSLFRRGLTDPVIATRLVLARQLWRRRQDLPVVVRARAIAVPDLAWQRVGQYRTWHSGRLMIAEGV